MVTHIFTKSNFKRLSECFLLLIVIGPKAVLCDQYPWCYDYYGYFDLNSYYYNKNCDWVGSYPMYRCSIDGVKDKCPQTCNNCECMNSRINFLVENTVTDESFHATCDWVKQNVKARCGSEYSGPLENCPLYCGSCSDAAPSSSPSPSPTKIPSSFPSRIPSSFPTSPPSYKPSVFPSYAPSSLPSIIPSLDPSLNPSMTPTIQWCPTQGFLGETIFVKVIAIDLCLKIELFANGILGLEPSNLSCTSTASDPLKVKRESFFQNVTGAIAYYDKGEFGKVGWSGQLRFKEDEDSTSMTIQKSDLTLDNHKHHFSADISVPICMTPRPSAEPSPLPSAMPSVRPSKTPSLVPSEKPIVNPSHVPSEILSTTPSLAPSVECDLNHLMGRTILSEMTSITSKICLKMEIFQGGVFSVDLSSQGCADTNSPSFQTISFFQNITNNTLSFDKGTLGFSGWSGHFTVVEDPTAIESETTLLSSSVVSGNTFFEAELKISTCTAPSFSPSFLPSLSPTPACNVDHPGWIGDGFCDDDRPGYYTEQCDWDGGDCDDKNTTYPLCPGPLGYLEDCLCDIFLNTTECGFDGGDCIRDLSDCRKRF